MVFGLGQRKWEDTIFLEFHKHINSKHTKTERYECNSYKHSFDFYAPLFLLSGLNKVPDILQVAISKSFRPGRTIGFLSEPLPLLVESDACEYEFVEEKGWTYRYDLVSKNQIYGLYIPKDFFEGLPHPKRVYVKMGVSANE